MVDISLLVPPEHTDLIRSAFVFPIVHLSQADWKPRLDVWTSVTGHRGILHNTLGEWLHPSHRVWEWFYYKYTDNIYLHWEGITAVYGMLPFNTQVCLLQIYQQIASCDKLPTRCIPANVLIFPGGTILKKGIGSPALAIWEESNTTFWTFLQSFGGEWMWEHLQEGGIDMTRICNAFVNEMLIGVTDRSFDRVKAKSVSRSGWVLVCTHSQWMLQGLLYEISHNAGFYQGELLGLVTIHSLI
jgi:hypothetical protein